jgi:hypothetical protein
VASLNIRKLESSATFASFTQGEIMKKSLVGKLSSLAMIAGLTLLVSCGGGGGGGGSTFGSYQSPNATAQGFVNGLNNTDPNFSLSEVELEAFETVRSGVPGQDDWFVIWDARYSEYKAVSLQYIRSVVYFDFFSNNSALAEEFRAIETDDILFGDINGDFFGDDYEVVDLLGPTGFFVGRNSGFLYEDEDETYDVALLTGEAQKKEFYKKAANVSLAYSVSIETSMALVTLGSKVESMLGKNQGEVTDKDQASLVNDFSKLTGATLADVALAAAGDATAKAELVKKVAKKIGTSASNLEQRILPELFGVQL